MEDSHQAVTAKCLEKLFLNYVTPLITDPHQFAYRPGRSTEDALLTSMGIISNHLVSHPKHSVESVFVDFTSAFNTMSPTVLVNKLIEHNIHPNIIRWTHSYLMVISNNKKSAVLTISISSPQGCVLSPALFSIYTIDIRSTSNSTFIIKYADDTLIMELSSPSFTSTLQQTMDDLHQLCKDRNLLINATKTKSLTFPNARDTPSSCQLTINDSQLVVQWHSCRFQKMFLNFEGVDWN